MASPEFPSIFIALENAGVALVGQESEVLGKC